MPVFFISRECAEAFEKHSFFVSIVLLLAFAAGVLSGCGASGDGGATPNVVIITLDTVRADHMGCYGYERDTSPNIDAFAKTATLYKRAAATSPWTVPTHASFFTGKFPFEHGAHAFKVEKGEVNNVNPLPKSQLTLAEIFWDEGYTTGAFVANDAYLGPYWQLNQGFETYQVARLYAPELNERVFGWLDVAAKKPFFLFVNYIDAHKPYNTRPQPGLAGVSVIRDQGELVDSLYNVVMPGTAEPPAWLVQKVTDQYDTAVRNVDEQFGRLLERLERLGVYENTIIVLTSDHGEFLGEHNLVEHSKDVYEETVAMPLIIKNPSQKSGEIVETLVAATDVPHLILSQFPGDPWAQHLERFPDAPGTHEVISELYYTRTKDLFHPVWGHRFDRIRTVFYDWPYKYISSTDGKNELYNLEDDPGEASNLLAEDPTAGDNYAQRLSDFVASRVRSEEMVDQRPLSEEEKKRLKSLGYLGD